MSVEEGKEDGMMCAMLGIGEEQLIENLRGLVAKRFNAYQ